MNDMSAVIVPKSDQISADDLISGPITIRIAKVEIKAGSEQPVNVHFEGDDGRPWRPCKSMSRVLVAAWGPDSSKYAGHAVTLYRDPRVKWGGMEVGGIRISHLSHINGDMVLPLTATKGKKIAYAVKALQEQRSHTSAPSTLPLTQRAEGFLKRVADAQTDAKLDGIWAASEGLRADLDAAEPELLVEIVEAFQARRAEIAADGEEPA